MEFPFEQGPEQETGAPNQDIWGFNPESSSGLPGADASLDDLLALYQAPAEGGASPFASLGEPDAYPAFPDFTTGAPAFGEGDLGFGGFDASADAGPFPDFTSAGSGDFLAASGDDFSAFGTQAPSFEADALSDFSAPFDSSSLASELGGLGAPEASAEPFQGTAEDDDPFAMPGAPVFPPMAESGGADPLQSISEEDDPFAMPGAPVFPPMIETGGDDLLQAVAADDDPFAMPGAPVFPPMIETGGDDLLQAVAADDDPFAMPGAPVFPPMIETGGDDLLQAVAADDDPFVMPGAPVFAAVPEAEEERSSQIVTADDDPFAMPGAPVFAAVPEAEEERSSTGVGEEDDPFAMPGAPVFAPLTDEISTDAQAPMPEPVVEQVVSVPAAPAEVHPVPVAAAMPAASFAANSSVLDPSSAHEVVLRSAEERKQLHAQVDDIVKTLNHQLDEVQTNLAFLYSELQKAAVRRAPVGDIMGITEQISHSRKRVGQDSEAYKQAQYLRQVADAYMALMQEL